MPGDHYSHAPVALGCVGWQADGSRPGCTQASLAFLRQDPQLRHYAPLLDALVGVPWARYGIDIRSGYMAPRSYFGIPWWHTDFANPASPPPEPSYYYVCSNPANVAPLKWYEGVFHFDRKWGGMDQTVYDQSANDLEEGRWHRFAPLTLHKASMSYTQGSRLFVRVRPIVHFRNIVENSCTIYVDVQDSINRGIW